MLFVSPVAICVPVAKATYRPFAEMAIPGSTETDLLTLWPCDSFESTLTRSVDTPQNDLSPPVRGTTASSKIPLPSASRLKT